MLRMWELIHSLLGGSEQRYALPARVPVVALGVSEEDTKILRSLAAHEPWDFNFAGSCENARSISNQLTSPVILLDRDWPGKEWRTAGRILASAAHRPCVILVSSVADSNLWQELMRNGGYDVLGKPLRPANARRAIKLALSYWTSAPKPAVQVKAD